MNDHVLGIHHVCDDAPLAWDVGFLAPAIVQLALGAVLYRSSRRPVLSDASG